MLKHMVWEWQALDDDNVRAKVIGGWLVMNYSNDSKAMCFIPDRDHEWVIIEPKVDPIIEQSTLANDFAS
jgi:hypothetical protein